MVKNLPAFWETRIRSLGWEDPLEKGVATHSNILARRIPWTEEPGGLESLGSKRVRHNWVTNTLTSSLEGIFFFFFFFYFWKVQCKWICLLPFPLSLASTSLHEVPGLLKHQHSKHNSGEAEDPRWLRSTQYRQTEARHELGPRNSWRQWYSVKEESEKGNTYFHYAC